MSMGNPHAVQVVEDVKQAPVQTEGRLIELHPRFPARVNAGFMQVLSRGEIALRVFERGAGETLACGTGACAAAVAGMQQGLLDHEVRVRALCVLAQHALVGGRELLGRFIGLVDVNGKVLGQPAEGGFDAGLQRGRSATIDLSRLG